MIDVDTAGAGVLRQAIGTPAKRVVVFAVSRADRASRSRLEKYDLMGLIDQRRFYPANRHAAVAFREESASVGGRAIPPKFLGKVWALEPGEMTEVLRGDFGYGILLVVDKRARGPYPFEEMQEQVTGQLRKSRIDAAVASLVATRRAAARVEGLTPETAAALKP